MKRRIPSLCSLIIKQNWQKLGMKMKIWCHSVQFVATYFLSKLLLINLVKYLLCFQIGSFFMINLCLVVIATQFSETKRRETAKMKAERARYRSSSTLSSFTTSETTNCYRQVCLGFKFYFVHWKSTMGKMSKIKSYTGSLAPADFSGAVFIHMHFQKVVQISSLCYFHDVREGIPSLVHFWLLLT